MQRRSRSFASTRTLSKIATFQDSKVMNFHISVNSLKSDWNDGVTLAWGDTLLLLLKVEKI